MKKIPPIIWILGLALSLRLISLNQSLWLDEGIQWWAVTTFPLKHLVTEYIKGDFNPPLFHLILYFWVKVFGDSEISLRLPSVIFGTATVYFIYKIALLIFTEKSFTIKNFKLKVPEIVALLTATSGLLVYYSQEARMYSLTALTALGSLYSLLKLHQNRSKLFTFYFLLFTCLMFYSHYLTWLLIPILLLLEPLFTGIILLFLVPWLPILWQQLNQGLGAASNPVWANLSSLSLKNILLMPVKFLIGRLPVEANLFYALILFLPLCLVTYILFQSIIRTLAEVKKLDIRRYPLEAILWLWFLTPLILGTFISLKIPIFSYFRFLFLTPIVYLLIIHGISLINKKNQWLLIGFFICTNLLTSSFYLINSSNHREDWKSAAAYIHLQPAPVFIYEAVRSPFEYYDRGQSLRVSEDSLDEAIGKPDVWYISYAQPIFDPQNKVRSTLENLGFQEITKRHFRGVTVIRYKNLNYNFFTSAKNEHQS